MQGRFHLTRRAKDDLRGIWIYTQRVWGEEQADTYVTRIYRRFSWLAQQAHMGKHRPDIVEGCYCFPHASHLIFLSDPGG